MKLPNNHSLKWVIFFVGLLASWLSFSRLMPMYIFILVWLAAFVFLAVHKSYLRYFAILFSSWVFLPLATFVKTTNRYFQGTAVFYEEELNQPEALNLNRKFRVWSEKKGPAIWGDETFVTVSNNFTVRFWVTIRGYQQGSYTGIYPDPTQAAEIIRTLGQKVPFEKPSKTIRITLENGLLEFSDPKHIGAEDLSSRRLAKVATVENELIIIQPLPAPDPSILYLADRTKGHIIARYFGTEKTVAPEKRTGRRRKNRGQTP